MRRPLRSSRPQITRSVPAQSFRRIELAAKIARPRTIAERREAATALLRAAVEPNAYAGYKRILTEEGGVHITYRNVDTRWRHTIRRILVWTACTVVGGWLLLYHEPLLSDGLNFLGLIALMIVTWLIVRRPIEIYCSVEIRHDCMVLDGEDVFRRDLMEGGLPTFQPDEEDENMLVLGGIYGTRLVEFIKAHRFDQHDRTPELLATHLEDAMEQIWSRADLAP
jgi:hypothetical protein